MARPWFRRLFGRKAVADTPEVIEYRRRLTAIKNGEREKFPGERHHLEGAIKRVGRKRPNF